MLPANLNFDKFFYVLNSFYSPEFTLADRNRVWFWFKKIVN